VVKTSLQLKQWSSEMAKALIVNDEYGQFAEQYYLKFPQTPSSATASLQVETPAFIKQTSLDTLLSSIQNNAKAGSDLVIVSHGNDLGWTMGLFHRHPKVARTDHLITLMGGESLATKAEKLSLKPALVDQLLAKVQAVQKIGLGHIACRGCSIGSNIRNLTTLKDLLGAKIVSATNLLSDFGHARPEYFDKDAQAKKRFETVKQQLEGKAHVFSGKSTVLFLIWPDKKDPLKQHNRLILESEGGMLEWLQHHFISGTPAAVAKAVRNSCPVHYLLHQPPIFPLDGTHKTHNPVLAYADFIHTSDEPIQ
jgi:hypothetical protein